MTDESLVWIETSEIAMLLYSSYENLLLSFILYETK
jgi:hypothetical protein